MFPLKDLVDESSKVQKKSRYNLGCSRGWDCLVPLAGSDLHAVAGCHLDPKNFPKLLGHFLKANLHFQETKILKPDMEVDSSGDVPFHVLMWFSDLNGFVFSWPRPRYPSWAVFAMVAPEPTWKQRLNRKGCRWWTRRDLEGGEGWVWWKLNRFHLTSPQGLRNSASFFWKGLFYPQAISGKWLMIYFSIWAGWGWKLMVSPGV